MIAPEDLQVKIAVRLSWRLREQLVDCTGGNCGGGCGDVCAIRAREWRHRYAERLRRLFSDPAVTVHEFHFSCWTWHQKPNRLRNVKIATIFKAARRVLNSLNDPTIIAVGLVDAAWNGSNKWKVGITILALTSRSDGLRKALSRTENVVSPSVVEIACRPNSRLVDLLRSGQQAKHWPDGRPLLKPGVCREYYQWLAGIKPNARIFRYGVDRHFHVLEKQPRPVKLKVPKSRSSPTWLEPYQYGSHPHACNCKICSSRQN